MSAEPTVSSYIMVPESLILDSIEAAKQCGEEKEALNFKKVLKVGQKFKDAKMHPLYLFDHVDHTIIVVAEETFGKKLH